MLKKVLALALAGAMVVGSMSMMAFASEETNTTAATAMTADTALKISGLEEGDEVTFYQVVKWVGSTDPNNWGGWQVNGGFTDVIATSDALGKIVDTRKSDYSGLTSEVAGDLSRSAGVGAATKLGTYTVATGKDFVEVTSGVTPGLYMAIIKPADVNTVYNPVFVSADWFQTSTPDTSEWIVTSDTSYYTAGGAQGAAKKTTLEVNKESDGYENELDTDNSDPGDTVKPGDVLDFTVSTTIPGYGETFDQPTFILKDTMDDLKYNKDIVIHIGDKDGAVLADTNYVVTHSDDDGYVISFKPAYLKTLGAPVAITAVYTAEVLAPMSYESVNKEQNNVEIVYSHDPSTETTPGNDEKEYQKDITNHYTFSIDANNIGGKPDAIGESMTEIIKVAVDREGNPIFSEKVVRSTITSTSAVKSPLAGCVFKLTKINDTTAGNDPAVVKTVTSDDNGRILFEGLDEGEYTLEEISAPSGYVKDTSVHTIVIDAELAPKKYVEWYDQAGNWYESESAAQTAANNNQALTNKKVKSFEYEADELVSYTITFDGHLISDQKFDHKPNGSSEIKWSSSSRELPSSIHNTQGVELPSTGGIGTTIFYAGGAVLVLLAGVLLVSKRRIA